MTRDDADDARSLAAIDTTPILDPSFLRIRGCVGDHPA